MTNKAKIYLKNIQEADTEKKLVGIEIAKFPAYVI